jgi:hypothetical protein
MKISQIQPPTIPALALEKRVEAVKVRPALDAGLQDYLSQNPTGVPLGGPSGWVAASGGISLGAPVLLSPGFELLPLFNSNGALNKVMESLEQLPELPHDGEIAVHVIGLVRPLAKAVTALSRPGSMNRVELSRAVVQSLAGLVRLVADIPGLESAKPYTDGLYLVLQVSGELCVLPHPVVIRQSSGEIRT